MCTNPNSGKIICADTAYSLQEKVIFFSGYFIKLILISCNEQT